MKTQTLRIIGGTYKRRTVSFAAIEGLRPTPDRLRETLFNWLMYDIANAHILDVCAGSGALSWEALSRGAAHATLIEPNRKQFAMLKKSAGSLDCEHRMTLINHTAQAALARLDTPFDIIFLDPPYSLNLWQPLYDQLTTQGLIDNHTVLYVEADKPHADILNTPMTLTKETKVGQIYAGIYRLAD